MAVFNQDSIPSLIDLSIEGAAKGLQTGRFTSVDLVQAYNARIQEVADLKPVLQVNPDALSDAQSLDAERTNSGPRGPLHGIPILVKDNIVIKDSHLDASAGSFTLLGAKPKLESSLIARLRAAGAIILGKTNLSEWSNFRGLNIPGGWSPRGGQTLAAYYPNSEPDGSSSGSAVSAALGLAIAALGTETLGSITDPAEINNVVGLKPSRGLIAIDGVIPISQRQDVVGTLTRNVKDASILLTYMAGRSDLDERTQTIPWENIPDFSLSCTSTALDGIKIGVPRNAFTLQATSPIMTSFEAALEKLASAGAEIVDNANFSAADDFKKLNQQVKGIVRSSEFKRDVKEYLSTLATNPNKLGTAEDIIEYTKSDHREDYPARDIGKFLWTQAEGIDVDSEKYVEMIAQERFFGGEGGILGAIKRHSLDVLATPSTVGIANDLASKMGYPVITVPLGFWPADTPVEIGKDGLVKRAPGIPYCVMFITNEFSDATLLRVAHAFEQLSLVRQHGPRPWKSPTTEIVDVLGKATTKI